MNKEILIILPSRSGDSVRYPNVDRFIENWKLHTEGLSDLCVALDDDDDHQYPRRDGIIYEVNPRIRMIPTLNQIAVKYKDQYKYIAFFGDDHIIQTKWETIFIEYFVSNNGVGIAYGNDLLQGAKLPTAVCLTSNIVTALGYMVPKNLLHMYADNFWLDLGNSLNIIKYFDNIIFEHVHPDNGKAERDSQYIDAANVAPYDQAQYQLYVNSNQLAYDIDKVKLLFNNQLGRYKTFDQPHSHDAEWYKDREVADHINQAGHRPRLLQIQDLLLQLLQQFPNLTICDFGCGNAGLIREIQSKVPNKIWGYDLSPANVEDAISKGNVDNVFYKDFIIDNDIIYPDIAICTEVLEHLVDPDAFIKRLLDNGVKYILASSPDYETPSYHAPFHLWVFNGDSYKEMFIDAGWDVVLHHKDYFQYIVAQRKS
jgi:2-polyprenyl-3-methyl-5-hydroxy-6-metoxy-1,4-benzoquinol methylase